MFKEPIPTLKVLFSEEILFQVGLSLANPKGKLILDISILQLVQLNFLAFSFFLPR